MRRGDLFVLSWEGLRVLTIDHFMHVTNVYCLFIAQSILMWQFANLVN